MSVVERWNWWDCWPSKMIYSWGRGIEIPLDLVPHTTQGDHVVQKQSSQGSIGTFTVSVLIIFDFVGHTVWFCEVYFLMLTDHTNRDQSRSLIVLLLGSRSNLSPMIYWITIKDLRWSKTIYNTDSIMITVVVNFIYYSIFLPLYCIVTEYIK